MADVVFSAFDEIAGPVAIFSTIKDPILTKKIAVKSIVSTLTSVRSSVSERLFEDILKKAREIPDEMVANHYLTGEFLSFSTKLANLKDYCLSGRQGKVKDVARTFNVTEEYLFTPAEALRSRRDSTAKEINRMFRESTDFKRMDIRSSKNVGFIR
jgi:hypothetical protein